MLLVLFPRHVSHVVGSQAGGLHSLSLGRLLQHERTLKEGVRVDSNRTDRRTLGIFMRRSGGLTGFEEFVLGRFAPQLNSQGHGLQFTSGGLHPKSDVLDS